MSHVESIASGSRDSKGCTESCVSRMTVYETAEALYSKEPVSEDTLSLISRCEACKRMFASAIEVLEIEQRACCVDAPSYVGNVFNDSRIELEGNLDVLEPANPDVKWKLTVDGFRVGIVESYRSIMLVLESKEKDRVVAISEVAEFRASGAWY